MEDVAFLRGYEPGMNYSFPYSRTSLSSRLFCVDGNVLYYNMVTTSHMWLLSV